MNILNACMMFHISMNREDNYFHTEFELTKSKQIKNKFILLILFGINEHVYTVIDDDIVFDMINEADLLYILHMYLNIDVYIKEYPDKVLDKKLYQIHQMFE
jgi:hypothetical protein